MIATVLIGFALYRWSVVSFLLYKNATISLVMPIFLLFLLLASLALQVLIAEGFYAFGVISLICSTILTILLLNLARKRISKSSSSGIAITATISTIFLGCASIGACILHLFFRRYTDMVLTYTSIHNLFEQFYWIVTVMVLAIDYWAKSANVAEFIVRYCFAELCCFVASALLIQFCSIWYLVTGSVDYYVYYAVVGKAVLLSFGFYLYLYNVDQDSEMKEPLKTRYSTRTI
jgi:hypothetical protein